MHMCKSGFRVSAAIALAICWIARAFAPAAAADRLLFHAALVRSTPAANSRLETAPDCIRLVFSEGVVANLSRVSLIDPDGKSTQIHVATDPRDSRVLLGDVEAATPGRYTVSWHVVSEDGHATGGTFEFTVAAPTNSGVSATGTQTLASSSTSPAAALAPLATQGATTTESTKVPILASILRGVGVGAIMAGIGLLFFGSTRRVSGATVAVRNADGRPSRLVVRLIGLGSVLLVAHLLVWMRGISPTGGFSAGFISSVFESTPGRLESIRVVLALLTLFSVGLTRRWMVGVILGVACLAVSGAAGHPAGIQPMWTIPSKAVHLIAGAAWLGGLLWLLTGARHDDADFPAEAQRVSSIALISVIAILLSGTIQVRFFLSRWSDLIDSTYGQLALIKILGILILIGLGAFNRFLLLPAVDDTATRPALRRTVRQEIALITVLIIVGGFLAYVPTPAPPLSATAGSTN